MTGEFPPSLLAFSNFSACRESSYNQERKSTLKKLCPYNWESCIKQCLCLLCSAELEPWNSCEPFSPVSLTRLSSVLCLPIATRSATLLPLKRERVTPDQKMRHDSRHPPADFLSSLISWAGEARIIAPKMLPTFPTRDLMKPGDHCEGLSGSPQVSQEHRVP